jgi:hypothetical protein
MKRSGCPSLPRPARTINSMIEYRCSQLISLAHVAGLFIARAGRRSSHAWSTGITRRSGGSSPASGRSPKRKRNGKRVRYRCLDFSEGGRVVGTSTPDAVVRPSAFARAPCQMVDLCVCCAGRPLPLSGAAGGIGMFTRRFQSDGLWIGQRHSLGSASVSLVRHRAKLPHGQSSARSANPARSAFRST